MWMTPIIDSHVYKTIQVTGTSTSSADEAVRTAVERAAVTVHNSYKGEVELVSTNRGAEKP
jgi:dodecin